MSLRFTEGPVRKESSDSEEKLHEEESDAELARLKRLRVLIVVSGSESSEEDVRRSATCRDALALSLLLWRNGKFSSSSSSRAARLDVLFLPPCLLVSHDGISCTSSLSSSSSAAGADAAASSRIFSMYLAVVIFRMASDVSLRWRSVISVLPCK
jgi:hypothetical protein